MGAPARGGVSTPRSLYLHYRRDGKIVRCSGLLGREFKETGEKLTLHVDKRGKVVAITFRDTLFEAVPGNRARKARGRA